MIEKILMIVLDLKYLAIKATLLRFIILLMKIVEKVVVCTLDIGMMNLMYGLMIHS